MIGLQELSAPQVSSYLLGFNDHYTSHSFVTFFWKTYVNEIYHAWYPDNNDRKPAKVTLLKHNKNIVGVSPTDDYIHRPTEIETLCLYDWIRRCKRKHLPSKKVHQKENNTSIIQETETIKEYEDICDHTYSSDDESQGENIDDDENPDVQAPTPKSMYRFLKSHPLFNSHGTIIKQDNPNICRNYTVTC